LTLSPKGNLLVSGGQDAAIKVWDVKKRKVVRTMTCPGGAVLSVDFATYSEVVLTAGGGGATRVWGGESGAEKTRYRKEVSACVAVFVGTPGSPWWRPGTIGFTPGTYTGAPTPECWGAPTWPRAWPFPRTPGPWPWAAGGGWWSATRTPAGTGSGRRSLT